MAGHEKLVHELPKVELHLHIEGTLEPEMMLDLSARNRVALPHATLEEVRAAYAFTSLQSFLDLYYQGAGVLVRAEDFHDLAWAYLQRVAAQNVRHVEAFFDPQTHTDRGIPLNAVLEGLLGAFERGERELGISWGLIPCFLRHLSADAAMVTLEQLLPHCERFVAVGLDSAEIGNPPERFAAVFERARAAGLRTVAHAGEEGPAAYVRGALDALGVARIDHGVRCLEDDALVERLVRERIPLTVCPLSNVALRVVERIEDHPLPRMIERGLVVTINSDDPAYFGGYLEDNALACAGAFDFDAAGLHQLAANAIEAAFIDEGRRRELLAELDATASPRRDS